MPQRQCAHRVADGCCLLQYEVFDQVCEVARHERIKAAMTGYLLAELRVHGCELSDEALLEIWATDLELNAQGLGVWLDSERA